MKEEEEVLGKTPEERGEAGLPVWVVLQLLRGACSRDEVRAGRAAVTWTMTETGPTFQCLFFH